MTICPEKRYVTVYQDGKLLPAGPPPFSFLFLSFLLFVVHHSDNTKPRLTYSKIYTWSAGENETLISDFKCISHRDCDERSCG